MAGNKKNSAELTETVRVTFVDEDAAPQGAALILTDSDRVEGYDRLYPGAGLDAVAQATGFKNKSGRKFSTFVANGQDAVQVFVRARGDDETFDYEMAVAETAKAMKGSGVRELTIHLGGSDATADDAARAALGARLASYAFNRHKSKATLPKTRPLETVRVAVDDPAAARNAYDNYYGPVGDGMVFARDLVNEPPNVLYPETYKDRLVALEELGLEIEVLGEAEMDELGMQALLGVGKGSERESFLVVLKHLHGRDGDAPALLVGKGLTFDSGGISLKPGANMWDMKGDMGGSAAVVGTMMALAKRKAKANVIGVVGLVENMPDGRAQNPGDIVTSMSGQTIEVQNTDAEGRLVLCDALHYSIDKYKPAACVDLATLTGAIVIGLGHEYAGLFSNDDGLAEQLNLAGDASTDKVWRMPLGKPYDKLLNSPNADMKNIGGRAAGSITAAQFLQRFVPKGTVWAHLDVAGTAMKPSGRHDARESTFGTGFGVRLLNRWIASNHEGAER
ncbi:leucyl aminopeptidase [uncultured Algimonas sp.]|uniref:leucyl aminopeptidase n=1 Tax=uncultured Algimonas sp. TaxID=1547920 RepID=UPI00262DF374|nr:leucyl aminopeptidase [uncultured Algimonas sp.]